MIRFSFALLVCSSILLLGFAGSFQDPQRDPVPSGLKVAHSNHCAGCHGYDESGMAMVDKSGKDVNIHDDWQISMMGLSSRDPFWRATLSLETALYPTQKENIEQACLKCHAPIGSFQASLQGTPYSFELMLADSLGLDGVSCSACHQQPSQHLGFSHNGNIILDTNRILYGPYPNPFEGPMQIYVGFEPVFSDHIYSSGICAGCHTLITETLDPGGLPTGNHFIEQATYHEWLNSIYPAQGRECQTCHMPFIQDSVVIATDLLSLGKRYPYGLHQFFGANTAMLTMMQDHQEELNLPSGHEEGDWNESIDNNRISLRRAANILFEEIYVATDTLYVKMIVQNKTGHKMPSGYPSRVSWLEVTLTSASNGDTLYSNGSMKSDGSISGRDIPFEAHHEISYSEDDVQIYEMVMADNDGAITTRLNAASYPAKDNRLLPKGFKRDHPVYDTTAIWGNALLDPQYNEMSQAGEDRIEFRIPLHGQKGYADLDVRLHYHTFPARWMHDLFQHDTIALVSQMKSMYAGYETFSELITQENQEGILLSTTAIQNPFNAFTIAIYPNPGTNSIQLQYEGNDINEYSYKLHDLHGKLIIKGQVTSSIQLPAHLSKGVYYFTFFRNGKYAFTKPYTIL